MLALGQHGLFLDEPTFGQDRRNAASLLDKLEALADSGRAIVAITHDMRLVAERAGRSIVMLGGRLVFDGPPLICLQRRLAASRRAPTAADHRSWTPVSSPLLAVDDVVQALGTRPRAVSVL